MYPQDKDISLQSNEHITLKKTLIILFYKFIGKTIFNYNKNLYSVKFIFYKI